MIQEVSESVEVSEVSSVTDVYNVISDQRTVKDLNEHTELKNLFENLGSKYKKMVIDFSVKHSIDLNTSRKWFYIGMGSSNFWFCEHHCRFMNPNHVESITKECGLTPTYIELVKQSLSILKKEIRDVIESLNLEESSITMFFNNLNNFHPEGFDVNWLVELFQHYSFTQVEPPLDYLSGLDFPNPNWK